MKIIITGATGFLGRNLAESFHANGLQVTATGRFSVGYMAKSMTMTIDKAKQKLNYFPRISNQQGFEKYAKWYHSK